MGQDCACAHLTNTVPAFLASSHKSNDRCEYKSKGQQKQGKIAFFHYRLFILRQILTLDKLLYTFFLVIC